MSEAEIELLKALLSRAESALALSQRAHKERNEKKK